MNVLLIQTILAAHSGEGEDTIWMQILVLVILAASLGIFSLVKAKANKFKEHSQDYHQDTPARESQRRWRWQIRPLHGRSAHRELSSSAPTVGPDVNKYKRIEQPVLGFNAPDMVGQVKSERESATKKEKDLRSGMELLELDFLLSIVENTNGGDEKDVIIREISFKEVLHRGELNQADSNALKVYATNKGNLYAKDIQCEAIKNLAERTAKLL